MNRSPASFVGAAVALLLVGLTGPALAQEEVVSFRQSAVDRLELVVRGVTLADAVTEIERQMSVTIQLYGDASFPVTLHITAHSRDRVIDVLAEAVGFLPLGSNPRYQLVALDISGQQLAALAKTETGSRTTTYRVDGADLTTAKSLLGEQAIPGLTVQEFAPLTSVILTGPIRSLLEAVVFLNRVFVSPRVVFIDFLVVQYFYDKSFDWGFDLTSGQRRKVSSASFSGQGSLSFSYSFVDMLNPSFVLNLTALIDDGDARVLSNPHVAVLDKHTGTINLTQEINVQVADPTSNSFGNLLMFQQVTAEVKLIVKPTIIGPNEIELEIKKGSQVQTFTSAQGAPIATTTNAISTIVRMANNQTLILGGLIDEQTTTSHGGWPGLRKLPLLGALFRSRSDLTNITETVIYIRPRLRSPAAEELTEYLAVRSQNADELLAKGHQRRLDTLEQLKKDEKKGKKKRRSGGDH